jgi:hypothetical protein
LKIIVGIGVGENVGTGDGAPVGTVEGAGVGAAVGQLLQSFFAWSSPSYPVFAKSQPSYK